MTFSSLVLADISLTAVIWWIVVGLIAGFLASLVMRGGGYGIVGDIVVGLVGALIGGFLASLVGLGTGGFHRNNHRSLYWRVYSNRNSACRCRHYRTSTHIVRR